MMMFLYLWLGDNKRQTNCSSHHHDYHAWANQICYLETCDSWSFLKKPGTARTRISVPWSGSLLYPCCWFIQQRLWCCYDCSQSHDVMFTCCCWHNNCTRTAPGLWSSGTVLRTLPCTVRKQYSRRVYKMVSYSYSSLVSLEGKTFTPYSEPTELQFGGIWVKRSRHGSSRTLFNALIIRFLRSNNTELKVPNSARPDWFLLPQSFTDVDKKFTCARARLIANNMTACAAFRACTIAHLRSCNSYVSYYDMFQYMLVVLPVWIPDCGIFCLSDKLGASGRCHRGCNMLPTDSPKLRALTKLLTVCFRTSGTEEHPEMTRSLRMSIPKHSKKPF